MKKLLVVASLALASCSGDGSSKLERSQVYVIGKQFAKDHLGDADYGFGDDGFIDYGDSTYHVTGVADLPGRRVRWTVQIKYNGGEWAYRDNWTEKGWVAQ